MGGLTRESALDDFGIEGAPELVYQPAVDLVTGRLLGFEALLRWKVTAPSLGFIPPQDLIPWAEETGRMTDLDAWIMTEACRQAAEWQSGLQISVNCSFHQLRHRRALEAVQGALETSGLLPGRLMVEVNEFAMSDPEARKEVASITDLGVELSLDDLGSSSLLNHGLDDLAVGTVKIAPSLVEGLASSEGPNRTVIEATVEFCRSRRICTVAESVETAEQACALRQMAVDVGQGYFFSPPIPADETTTLAGLGVIPSYSLISPREFVVDHGIERMTRAG